ncbi:MAG: DUF3224 domain-containing protein [Janthinobacterium lividum]
MIGRLDDREGSSVLQQLGHLAGDAQTLTYQVVPGTGTDGLTGVTGTLDADGTHLDVLTYRG